MKHQYLLKTCRLTALLITAAITPVVIIAQAPPSQPGDMEIKNVRQIYRHAPDYGSASGLGGKAPAANRPWLLIEVAFSSRPEWADDVTVKYHVLIGTGREMQLFTDSITHVDVRRSSRNYSGMFLHPNKLDRYGRGRVQAVAVQLFYQGRLMDQASDPPLRERWWEHYSPVTGHLLRPEDTPWSVVAHERFEAVKKETR